MFEQPVSLWLISLQVTRSDRLSALAVDCSRFDSNQHGIRLEGVIIIVNDETYFKLYARMVLCIPDHPLSHISSPSILEINLPGRGIKRVVSIYIPNRS